MEIEPLTDPELLAELKRNGYVLMIHVPGRGVCGLCRMAFTVGLFYGLDYDTYQGRYCFESMAEATEALFIWDGTGDPSGDWIKHKGGTGEYSNPNYTNKQVSMNSFNVSNTPIGPVDMTVVVAVSVIAQIQLATRHPGNNGPTREIAESFARELQKIVVEIAPENATILEMGWDKPADQG